MKNSYLLCTFAILLFSTHEIVGKYIDTSISPIAITCYRFFIGSLLLLIMVLVNRNKYLQFFSIKSLSVISSIGVLNVCISMFSLQLGIFYSQASISAIIISSNPIFVSIFAIFILKEKLSLKALICLMMGLLGLALVIFGQFSPLDNSRNLPLGIIFSIIASITFALYTVLSKQQVNKTDSLFFNAVSFFAGSVVLFLIGTLSNQKMNFDLYSTNALWLLYLGIFVTGIAYIAFFNGLKKINAASGSSFFLLKPVFASILAFFILNERLVMLQVIGVVIVISALFMQNLIIRTRHTK